MNPEYIYGNHEFWFKPNDDEDKKEIGLLIYCTKCNSKAFGTMHIREIKARKSPKLMVERSIADFKSKFPESCEESMVKQIMDL